MKRLLEVRDQNRSTSDPTPWQLDDDDIKMDLKQIRDGKAWAGFTWLTIGTVVFYNPHDTLQTSHKNWMFSNMAVWTSVLCILYATPLDYGTDHGQLPTLYCRFTLNSSGLCQPPQSACHWWRLLLLVSVVMEWGTSESVLVWEVSTAQ